MDPDKMTLIDAQAAVEGKLTGHDARILGRFKGDVTLQGRLVLGEGARLEGTVSADAAELAGEFKGELRVKSLLLLEKAHVEGTVDARQISMREGALLNGAVNAGVAPAPAPAPTPAPAPAPSRESSARPATPAPPPAAAKGPAAS
jgi:cytoskeletal protein CcmA (bactofilin family)